LQGLDDLVGACSAKHSGSSDNSMIFGQLLQIQIEFRGIPGRASGSRGNIQKVVG
jgi:hypothetical protein